VQAPPGVRLEIRVTASDPDGEGVASLTADLSDLPAGHDAAFQTTENRTAGTLTWTPSSAGGYDVRFTASNDLVGTATTHIEVASPTLAARAFLTKDEIPLRLNTGRSAACFRLEPVSGSFELTALDPASFTLRADSSGAGAGVDAVVEKSVRTGDRDGNGEDEISICFPRSDLAAVLGDVPVVATVPVAIEGALVSGERVRAEVDIAVKGGGTFPRVRLAPNPMNPAAVFTIETSRAGALRLALFDVSGRLVRMLVDQREASAGVRDVIFDGRSTSGSSLASGIYFFRVESPDGIRMGRITLLR
ncbi:MAG TPA: FlgD immunoglobulin-like domain containing protein, partial [Candidatus Eisenbacteria bacterium]|nr:FlgD immunoglobulin-like domain containing protein [Candidatus Eisenbacteria bacterium]